MSTLPVDLDKVDPKNIDQEILRAGIIAELDATSFYEQMAAKAQSQDIRKILLDIAKEEKTHMGEFQTLLLEEDSEQKEELEAGRKEVSEELQNEKAI